MEGGGGDQNKCGASTPPRSRTAILAHRPITTRRLPLATPHRTHRCPAPVALNRPFLTCLSFSSLIFLLHSPHASAARAMSSSVPVSAFRMSWGGVRRRKGGVWVGCGVGGGGGKGRRGERVRCPRYELCMRAGGADGGSFYNIAPCAPSGSQPTP